MNGGGSLMPTRPAYDPYLDNLKSPLIRDESDGKTLRLRYWNGVGLEENCGVTIAVRLQVRCAAVQARGGHGEDGR